MRDRFPASGPCQAFPAPAGALPPTRSLVPGRDVRPGPRTPPGLLGRGGSNLQLPTLGRTSRKHLAVHRTGGSSKEAAPYLGPSEPLLNPCGGEPVGQAMARLLPKGPASYPPHPPFVSDDIGSRLREVPFASPVGFEALGARGPPKAPRGITPRESEGPAVRGRNFLRDQAVASGSPCVGAPASGLWSIHSWIWEALQRTARAPTCSGRGKSPASIIRYNAEQLRRMCFSTSCRVKS